MFNRNISKIIILLITISTVALFSSSCYDEDGDAVVTIHLERNDLAAMGITPERELGIIDKILNFFSTRAEAASWSDDKTNMTLRVTSGCFDEKTFTLPSGATSFTTTLPSGCETTFIITTGATVAQKRWGGQISINLIPGEQDFKIQMIPMSWIYTADGSGHLQLYWINSGFPVGLITSYNIYKSSTINGTYVKVGPNVTTYNDTSAIIGVTYYFRISTNSIYGESVLSDPFPGSRMY